MKYLSSSLWLSQTDTFSVWHKSQIWIARHVQKIGTISRNISYTEVWGNARYIGLWESGNVFTLTRQGWSPQWWASSSRSKGCRCWSTDTVADWRSASSSSSPGWRSPGPMPWGGPPRTPSADHACTRPYPQTTWPSCATCRGPGWNIERNMDHGVHCVIISYSMAPGSSYVLLRISTQRRVVSIRNKIRQSECIV